MKGEINSDTIPEALTESEQWVCWQYDERDGNKPAKVPIQPDSRAHANVSDPETWSPFGVAEAVGTAKNLEEIGGIGFVFSEDDPFVGIDLDDCVEDGELADWAQDIVDHVDSYTEFSPSGTGVHIILRGNLPDGGIRDGDIEMYDTKRFFTVTGHHLQETPTHIKSRQDQLQTIDPALISTSSSQEVDGGTNDADDCSDDGALQKKGSAKRSSNNNPNPDALDQVRGIITEEFEPRTWDITEAALAAHATLMLDTNQNTGLVIVGNTGAGKTTALKFFEGESRTVRSDDVTPASFVSADASLSEEELEENDLLPRIQHKTLVCRDMATWFSGDRETVDEKMSVMAPLMDGDGYARDTGSHGRRGYTDGDYRFNFIGASTPLQKRAWKAMGHTGNRFVFHEKRGNTTVDEIVDDIFEGSDYGEKVERCRTAVQSLLENKWQTHEGYKGIQWDGQASPEIKQIFGYLTKLVVHARAPIVDGTPTQEGGHRIATTLRDLARGRAILAGRTQLQPRDAQVCARVALSTMPKDRRPVVRALLNPANAGTLTADEVELQANVSRPTAHNRMDELDTLGLAKCTRAEDDGREPKIVECRSDFEWPDTLTFPEF